MATSSIYKNILIKDQYTARKLVHALEKAEAHSTKEVVLEKMRQELKGDKIKEFFGDK